MRSRPMRNRRAELQQLAKQRNCCRIGDANLPRLSRKPVIPSMN
jgi:hypothetical protein